MRIESVKHANSTEQSTIVTFDPFEVMHKNQRLLTEVIRSAMQQIANKLAEAMIQELPRLLKEEEFVKHLLNNNTPEEPHND